MDGRSLFFGLNDGAIAIFWQIGYEAKIVKNCYY
jgi:hypothetical protein